MRATLLAGVAAAVAIASCGGDGDDGSNEPPVGGEPGLSKREFVERLDAICRRSDERGERFKRRIERARQQAATESEQYARAAEILRDALPDAQELQEDYEALRPPPEERRFFQRWLESKVESLRLARRSAEAAEREDATTLQALGEKINRLRERRNRLAASHGGFRHCGDEGK